jgi:hypothetical protein
VLSAQTIVNVHPVLHGEGYEFGWSFWVAFGTLALAAATTWLAWKTRAVAGATAEVARETRQLAQETTQLATRTAEDVAAQFRPIMIPPRLEEIEGGRSVVVLDTGTVHCFVVNVGSGPALNVEATLEPGGIAPRIWQNAAVATGTIAQLTFEGATITPEGMEVPIRYRDLGGARYRTTLLVQEVGNRYRIVQAPITTEPA